MPDNTASGWDLVAVPRHLDEHIAGFPVPAGTAAVVLVDARDLDPAERDLLAASRIRHVPAAADAVTAALAGFGRLPVYLHVDMDITDSTQLPGLRVPAGPGPGLSKIEACVTAITATSDVPAACIACTWLPGHINTPAAREALTRIARAIGTPRTWEAGEQAGTGTSQ